MVGYGKVIVPCECSMDSPIDSMEICSRIHNLGKQTYIRIKSLYDQLEVWKAYRRRRNP
jgi:hypothetical protein